MNATMNRRHCLRSSASTLGALAAAAAVGAPQARASGNNDDGESKKLVDTHLHCFAGVASNEFPYHRNAPYRPDDAATPQRLLDLMDEVGISHAVVVHPEPYQDDHRYLEYCLSVGKGRLKGTVLVFSDQPDSLSKLPQLARELDVVAVRVHAYAPDRLPPFGTAELRSLWQMAGKLGLAVQLHFEPRYAPKFEPLIREFNDVRVLIDHMGRPFQGTPDEHAVVLGWAKYPNTVMKLSAIPSPRNYPHRDVQPVVKQLTDAFGAERMMYGGGFNADATAESYAGAFAKARQLLGHLPVEQQDAILGGTASRLFGLNLV